MAIFAAFQNLVNSRILGDFSNRFSRNIRNPEITLSIAFLKAKNVQPSQKLYQGEKQNTYESNNCR